MLNNYHVHTHTHTHKTCPFDEPFIQYIHSTILQTQSECNHLIRLPTCTNDKSTLFLLKVGVGM